MKQLSDRYLDRETTDIDECIAITLRALSAANEMHLATQFPNFAPYTYGVDPGKKYNRIWVDNGTQKSVCFFVQRDTGDVWKAAGWKGPALNFTRGNILTPGGRAAITLGKVNPATGYFYPAF